jgi:benzoate/toluate 1,2-dioxygenase subunit beta
VIDLISHNPRMVGELLSNEAHLLDIAEYPEWLSLYTADAEYWMPVDPGAADPADSLNIILDDRSRLEDRVARLLSGSAHIESPPSVTRRIVSSLVVDRCAHGHGSDLEARSVFILVQSRLGQQSIIAGDYRHCLRWEGESLRIRRKRVSLLERNVPVQQFGYLL